MDYKDAKDDVIPFIKDISSLEIYGIRIFLSVLPKI